MSKSTPKYKLDSTSNRYRICPNDGVEFMASHRSRLFCCDKCTDEFHNKRKRDELTNCDSASIISAEPINDTSEKNIQDKNRASEIGEFAKVEENVKILNTLELKGEESVFSMDWLDSIGLNFDAFNGRQKLYNINERLDCYGLIMGPYRLYRIGFSDVLVKKMI